MDRSDSRRTPRSRTEVEGRIKAQLTLSSAVSRWIHRLRVAHHRKSVFSGLSRSRLELYKFDYSSAKLKSRIFNFFIHQIGNLRPQIEDLRSPFRLYRYSRTC